MNSKTPKRCLIPPMPPRCRLMREHFGVLIEIPQRGTALAQRCIDLINEDRIRAEAPPKGWSGR